MFVLAIFLIGTIASDLAFARGGRGGRGHHASGSMHFHRSVPRTAVVVTSPLIYRSYLRPYYYPPLYPYRSGLYYPLTPYYPLTSYYPAPPYGFAMPYYLPEYIERGPDQPAPDPSLEQPSEAQPPAPAYWWFCPEANTYYPYVKICPGGWQQVAPHAPPPS
jgi:hypothetical protein